MTEKLPTLEVKEVKTFDTKKYVGVKSKIGSIELRDGNYGKYFIISSEVLGTEDGNEVKASMTYGLKTAENGALVISDKGELAKLMQNKKVSDYRDLIGKDIVILDETKNGNTWLIFN